MSDFWIIFIFVFLLLIPPALILLGVLLRKERYGFQLFIIGWGITSAFLLHYPSELLAAFICRLLDSLGITASFHDTSTIDLLLFFLSIWCGFKLFRFISKPRKSKRYVEHAKHFLDFLEDPKLPSCASVIISDLSKVINQLPPDKLPTDISRTAEVEVYKIASFYVGSSDYRDVFGELNPSGMQMLSISRRCLDRLLEKGYITSAKHQEEMAYLKETALPLYRM